MSSLPPAKRASKPKPTNPILASISTWHSALPPELLSASLEELLSTAPKRWVVYPPMVLLPSGSFASQWETVLSPSFPQADALWELVLEAISKVEGKGKLTHLAINSGIPLQSHGYEKEEENILRSPSGLVMIYGDFGPDVKGIPGKQDFENAFWVSTKQNGITQVWAPRWTMFSRGNVKEKARVLSFEGREGEVAVDLYAGIGYFVFSYAKLGMRVLGWEINGWSVEGLRRGAGRIGWGTRVVREDEVWDGGGEERIVVFGESNERALERLMVLGEEFGRARHVNLGLLPTSEGSWEMALGILKGDGWIHVHENVGVNDVETKKAEIGGKFRIWLEESEHSREVQVEHVEFVKTFAPGVWHCVFDVYITHRISK